MDRFLIWVPSKAPYNSLNLQARLLKRALEENGCCVVDLLYPSKDSNKGEIIEALSNSSYKRKIWIYGAFCKFWRNEYAGVAGLALFYHNITPARTLLPYQPLVACRAALGRLQLRSIPRTAKWYTCSNYNAWELRKYGFEAVELVPNVVDIAQGQLKSMATNGAAVLSVLFVGRIAPNKRCLTAIKLIGRAADILGQEITLRVVGSVKKRDLYGLIFQRKVQARRAHLKIDWISTPVSVDDLARIYNTSTLYFSASNHEGFGLPVLEAVLHGCPALYTRSGGTESVMNSYGCIDEASSAVACIVAHLRDYRLRASLWEKQFDIASQYLPPVVFPRIRKIMQANFA